MYKKEYMNDIPLGFRFSLTNSDKAMQFYSNLSDEQKNRFQIICKIVHLALKLRKK